MSQTKHRSFRVDSNSYRDEVEQKMDVKEYRAIKKAATEADFEEDDFADSNLYAEIDFLLHKKK